MDRDDGLISELIPIIIGATGIIAAEIIIYCNGDSYMGLVVAIIGLIASVLMSLLKAFKDGKVINEIRNLSIKTYPKIYNIDSGMNECVKKRLIERANAERTEHEGLKGDHKDLSREHRDMMLDLRRITEEVSYQEKTRANAGSATREMKTSD